jgi:acyl dehydratase
MSGLASVAAGDRLPEREIASVDPGRMRTAAALIDDPVPIHYDVSAVREQGLGDREINQGPLAFGYLVELIAEWTGDVHAVRKLRCRFHTNVFAGDHLVCSGEVTGVDVAAGTCILELAITRDGDVVVSGAATVLLDQAHTASNKGSLA